MVGTRTLLKENGIRLAGNESEPLENDSKPGETLVYVGRDSTLLGVLTVADQLRNEAIQAVGELKRKGYRTLLLTGDSSEAASAIGGRLGVRGNRKPIA